MQTTHNISSNIKLITFFNTYEILKYLIIYDGGSNLVFHLSISCASTVVPNLHHEWVIMAWMWRTQKVIEILVNLGLYKMLQINENEILYVSNIHDSIMRWMWRMVDNAWLIIHDIFFFFFFLIIQNRVFIQFPWVKF